MLNENQISLQVAINLELCLHPKKVDKKRKVNHLKESLIQNKMMNNLLFIVTYAKISKIQLFNQNLKQFANIYFVKTVSIQVILII